MFQRAGRIAGLEPVDNQDEFGDGIARVELQLLLRERASAVEMADAYFHEEGPADQLGRVGIGRDRLLVRARRRGEVAQLLGMPAGEIFAEEVFGTGCRRVLLRPSRR